MRTGSVIFLLLGFFQGSGQSGNYFLSHHSPHGEQFDNVCFDILQGGDGMLYVATRSGIQQFDGRSWTLIQGSGAVYSLEMTPQGEILWSGTSGFGIVEKLPDRSLKLTRVSGEGISDIFESQGSGSKMFFLAEKAVSIYDTEQCKSFIIPATTLTGSFTGICEIFGSVYVNTTLSGVVRIENDKLVRAPLGLAGQDEIIFASGSGQRFLIGLSDSRILLCSENLKLREIKLADSAYIQASVVVNGSWVKEDLFVLGTLRGGMIFIDAETGKTEEIINYSTGLPDNEIYTLLVDQDRCIWAAHEYGFTRVAPDLPYRSFGHYPGLSGNLLCAISFKNSVYVGTSLGLFKLTREDLYDELTFYVDVALRPAQRGDKKTTAPDGGNKTAAPIEQAVESRKKGFLRFFRKKDKPEQTESTRTSPLKTPDVDQTSAAPLQYRKAKKIEKVLRASQYVYKKVDGIDAKVTQLLEMDGRLIAGGLGGIYEVSGAGGKAILEEPVRMAYASGSMNKLFISTYANEVRVFARGARGWSALPMLNNLDDQITGIFEGINNELWLCALDKAYRLEIADNAVREMQHLEIDNPNFSEVIGVRWRDDIVMAHAQGFFVFDRAMGVLTPMDSLPKPSQYFAGEGNILYNDAHSWRLFGMAHKTNLQLLKLLSNVRFIKQDQISDNLWVITGNNELYKFFGDRFRVQEEGFSLVLKAIRGGEGKKNKRNIFEFDQEKSALTFEVVQPDYLAAQAIEYRYLLNGLDKEWTDWSVNSHTIAFPYLPAGDYTLRVQSRDIFGMLVELEALPFEVVPPYWKRPWFYALEFFLFAAFVLLSFRLSTRYRIISRILSLLTIIMLIQFIQTVIGETFETRASPVMDFFVQVTVAFMILPVEGYLRNLMLRSLDSHSGLYRFLSPKTSVTPEGKEPEQ
ncbi:MAG TPA: triple tyrosine motif-containing protein [Ohtaekwangia sp.]|nr:triple tyrosine motif-containing protein [Ohtaekwangia sp.]